MSLFQSIFVGAVFTSWVSYIFYKLKDQIGKHTMLITMSVMTGLFALLFLSYQYYLTVNDTETATQLSVFDEMRNWRWVWFGCLLGCIPGWLVYAEKMTSDVFLWVNIGVLAFALVWVAICFKYCKADVEHAKPIEYPQISSGNLSIDDALFGDFRTRISPSGDPVLF